MATGGRGGPSRDLLAGAEVPSSYWWRHSVIQYKLFLMKYIFNKMFI